ncbi:MAG: 4-hydroxybenzoate octaprenyltransferase [Desulfovibrionaceae bacterium]|nr:4-hydroxybenzoate octaprenyltransferase [Desulfovibrionaceae bacterium]
MRNFLGSFGMICRMIKIEHSIFALPYAWAGSILAARGFPSLSTFILLTLAMVAIRSFAMASNRLIDLPFDKANPRTRSRALVTGEIAPYQTAAFCCCMAFLFIFFCASLNETCFYLSFFALVFVLIYSFLKRFTIICHFWLGASLGLAPIAGWLAVNPSSLPLSPVLLGLAVTFWVGAFDIYYSFQDIKFDRAYDLYSVPAILGEDTGLAIAGFSHCMTGLFLILTGIAANLSFWWYVICCIIFTLLILEHRLMLPKDLRLVNTAFFTINGIISPVMLLGVMAGIFF